MVIEVEGLTKRFGRRVAIDDVSLSLSAGLVYGLVGSNGAGKSVFLRVLAALERPSRGRVSVAGRDIFGEPGAVRRAVGYVPDEYVPARYLTVSEHLAFVASCRGLGRGERLTAVESMLELAGLTGEASNDVVRLSRGQQRRLALSAAMLHDPDVLLLDEPLADLDVTARAEMFEVLSELRSMGKTVVLTSHALHETISLCDAIGVLHQGRLVASQTEPSEEAIVQIVRELAA